MSQRIHTFVPELHGRSFPRSGLQKHSYTVIPLAHATNERGAGSGRETPSTRSPASNERRLLLQEIIPSQDSQSLPSPAPVQPKQFLTSVPSHYPLSNDTVRIYTLDRNKMFKGGRHE